MSGSQSGIAIDDECVNKFNELKLGKNVRYAIFKIADDHKSVVFEKEAPTSATWEDFVGELPRNDARYGIFDFEYEVDGGKRNKIVFVLWAPDESPIKQKMMYTSTKDSIKKKFVGIGTEVQACDLSEVDRAEVLSRVTKV
ncbi:cofilin, variant 2 [Balamuthia mandrillaris]